MVELAPLWERINARFWDGRLPDVRLEYADLNGADGFMARRSGVLTVGVSPRLALLGGQAAFVAVYLVLVHESMHVAHPDVLRSHGWRFAREARRIALLLGLPRPRGRDLHHWPTNAVERVYSEGAWHEV